jgi:hypothetical protein
LELAGKLGGIDKWRGGEFAQPAKTLPIPLLWKIVGTARSIAPPPFCGWRDYKNIGAKKAAQFWASKFLGVMRFF